MVCSCGLVGYSWLDEAMELYTGLMWGQFSYLVSNTQSVWVCVCVCVGGGGRSEKAIAYRDACVGLLNHD